MCVATLACFQAVPESRASDFITVQIRAANKVDAVDRLLGRVCEPWRTPVARDDNLLLILRHRCGDVPTWLKDDFTAKNSSLGFPRAVRAGVAIIPPCARFEYHGRVRIPEGSTLSAQLLEYMGTATPDTIAAALQLNPDIGAGPIPAGKVVTIPYKAEPVSLRLLEAERDHVQAIVDEIHGLGAQAEPAADLDLEREPSPSEYESDSACQGDFAGVGFDVSRVVEIFRETRARDARWANQFATIAIADTGTGDNETRLAFAENPGEAGALARNGRDDDGDGFVDDWIGIGTDHRRGPPTLYPGYDRAQHGTEVAGLCLGGPNAWQLMASLGNPIRLWVVNIVANEGTDAQPIFKIEPGSLITALSIAQIRNAQIVNLSVESPLDIDQFRQKASANSALLVVAAGNDWADIDSSPVYPAYYAREIASYLITVAALDPHDRVADFSNRGSGTVDIAARGVCVPTAGDNGQQVQASGTSFAAPLVSFTAALLFDEGLRFPWAIKERLLASADYDPDLLSKIRYAARLNPEKAVSVLDDVIQVRSTHLLRRGRIKSPRPVDMCEGAEWRSLRKIVPLRLDEQGTVRARVLFGRKGGYLDVKECGLDLDHGKIHFEENGKTDDIDPMELEDIVPASVKLPFESDSAS